MAHCGMSPCLEFVVDREYHQQYAPWALTRPKRMRVKIAPEVPGSGPPIREEP